MQTVLTNYEYLAKGWEFFACLKICARVIPFVPMSLFTGSNQEAIGFSSDFTLLEDDYKPKQGGKSI